MHSKKSTPRSTPTFPLKSERNCSESRIQAKARELASQVHVGDLYLLEGSMGVGKSTFARAFLEGLGIQQGGAGSPTFAIAHEYRTASGQDVMHADLYRLKFEEELEEAGVNAAIWERRLVCLVEWSSLFPDWLKAVETTAPGRVFSCVLSFEDDPALRSFEVQLLSR